MGSGAVTVDISGALRKLDALDQRMNEGLTDVWNGPVDRIVLAFFARQFETRGRAGGTPWAPLSLVTQAIKDRARRGNMGILRFTNRLWASLTKRAGPDTLLEVKPGSYRRGTRVPYALFHQEGYAMTSIFGVARRRGRAASRLSDRAAVAVVQVPARPLLPPQGLPDADKQAIIAALSTYLETGEVVG